MSEHEKGHAAENRRRPGDDGPSVTVPAEIAARARRAIERMIRL